MKTRLRCWCVVVLVLSSGALVAQDTASLTGTVTDKTGAAVANAQVTISNGEKGLRRTTTTNGSGDYLVAGLPAGTVNVTISATGFQTYEAAGIVLRVAQKARNDVSLQVGTLSTEVVVSGTQVAQVDTQSNEVAGTITGTEISQLQLNGRVFTQLVTLTPGVNSQTGSSEGQYGITANTNYSVNGGRLEYNNWELDGGDNMDNGSNATLNVTPSIDAIAEVRVLTSDYGAQYGRNASGTVETETKSGTSAFHGDAYEFVRNDKFNATPEFQSAAPSYKKNDWGYTIGGPIFIPGVYNTGKQKTFFFFSEEWRRDRVPGTNFNLLVPTVAERSGNFSDLCPNSSGSFADCPKDPTTGNFFPGNQVPVDTSNATPLLGLIPSPTGGSGNVYVAAPSEATNWREELVRVDHNLNEKMRLMFRYAHDSWETVTAAPLWSDGTSFPTIQTSFVGPAEALVARLSATASPTLLNEFVFSFTTDHIILNSTGTPNPNAWKRPAGMTMGSLFPAANNGGRLPGISVTGSSGGAYGAFAEDDGFVPNGPYNSNPTYTYRDNVTKILGKHNLQMGAYFVAAEKNELTGTNPSVNGLLTFDFTSPNSTGNAFADLLIGNVAKFTQASAQPKYYNRYKILEPYFQDDFHVTRRLTLNLGLRLSLFGTYRERYQQAYNFDPAAWNPAAAPAIDASGSITGQAGALIPGPGNPFNGMVQCGGPGSKVTASGFPNAAVARNSNAGCMTGHLFNPAPRIGFAFDPRGDGKTSIRAGYGIFYDHTNGNEADTEALESSPPLVQTPTQFNVVGYPNIGGSGNLLFPLGVVSIPDKATWPYVQQWHFDVEHEVLPNMVATVAYVGSQGIHLGRKFELNQLHPVPAALNPYLAANLPIEAGDCTSMTTGNGTPVTGQAAINLSVACGNNPNPFRPFLGYGDITRLDSAAASSYHALQTQLRRSVGALLLNAAYTFSHSIDDTSDGGLFGDGGILDAYHFSEFRASSNFDQRHVFTASAVYDLPFLKGSGIANKLAGGWQISGLGLWQTGTPFSVGNTVHGDNAGLANGVTSGAGQAQSYADVLSNPHANVPSSAGTGFGPFVANPAAYAAPIGLTLGNSGRNSLRNPGHWNIDTALFKHFRITERIAFEFRAEAFNIFNHAELGPITGGQGGAAGSAGFASNTGSFGAGSNFLQTGVAYSPRILQLGGRVSF